MSAAVRLLRPSGSGAPAVAAAWQGAWRQIGAAWPQLAASLAAEEAEIAGFVAERLDGEGDVLAAQLAAAPVADLALAALCARGDAAAQQAFEAYLGAAEQARVGGASRDQLDEVKQLLRVQMLVGAEGKAPGIAAYRGRGPLQAWLRIIATRELVRMVKGDGRTAKQELDQLELATTGDPALDQLKATYRAEFAAALRDAIGDLSFEDRLLLRQQIADQLSVDEIGVAHGVHRGTASRWLARARQALLAATQRRLSERLDLPAEEIASVIRLVHSRLDVSVVRYLRDAK
jgi:RNA polymerase sigma-70 factor, ECF subfamily